MRTSVLLLVLCLIAAPPVSGQALSNAELDKRFKLRTITFSGVERPAANLFDKIARAAGVDLAFSRAARMRLGGRGGSRLALPLKQVPLGDALGLLLQLTGLELVRLSGRLIVTTRGMATTYRTPVTRTYRIADLQEEWYPEQVAGLPDLAALLSRFGGFDDDGQTQFSFGRGAIIELIKSNVVPVSWESTRTSIDEMAGRLVVVAPPSTQREVAAMLARVRGLRSPQVRIDAWWVDPALVSAASPSMPIEAWRRTVKANPTRVRHLVLTGPVMRRLQLHDGPTTRLQGHDRKVVLATGLTLIVAAAPARDGATRVDIELQDGLLTSDQPPRLKRTRLGLAADIPAGRAELVLLGTRRADGRALVLAAVRQHVEPVAQKKRRVDPRELALRERLGKNRRDWTFEATPLQAVVAEIRLALGINILINPEILKELTEEELKVNLRVKAATARELLDMIGRSMSLGWTVRHGVVLVTKLEDLGAKARLATWDVRDLHRSDQDFAAGWRASRGIDAIAGVTFQEDEAGNLTIDRLSNLIRDNVHKETWEGENTIKTRNGVLYVRQAPKVIAAIDALLADLRKVRRPSLQIELTARSGDRTVVQVVMRTIDDGKVVWFDGTQRYDRQADKLITRDLGISARATLVSGRDAVRLQLRAVLPDGARPLRWLTDIELPLGREVLVGGLQPI